MEEKYSRNIKEAFDAIYEGAWWVVIGLTLLLFTTIFYNNLEAIFGKISINFLKNIVSIITYIHYSVIVILIFGFIFIINGTNKIIR